MNLIWSFLKQPLVLASLVCVGIITAFTVYIYGQGVESKRLLELKNQTILQNEKTINSKNELIAIKEQQILGLTEQLRVAKLALQTDRRIIGKAKTLNEVKERIIQNAKSNEGLDETLNPAFLAEFRALWCELYDEEAGFETGNYLQTGEDRDTALNRCRTNVTAETKLVSYRDLLKWIADDQEETIMVETRRDEAVKLIKATSQP